MKLEFDCGEERAEVTFEEDSGDLYLTNLVSSGPGALRKVFRFVQSLDMPVRFAFMAGSEGLEKVRPHIERHGAVMRMEVWELGVKNNGVE